MLKIHRAAAAILSLGLFIGGQSAVGQATAPYQGSQLRDMPTILDITGRYGVKMGGGHFLTSADGKQETFPHETLATTKQTVNVPTGAVIKYAFIYYGGVIGVTDTEGKDYTADKVNAGTQTDGLNDINHVKGNGLTFKINGASYTHDVNSRQPAGQSSIGSSAVISPDFFTPHYGTITGTKSSFWSNRIDITGLMQNKNGDITFEVSPPERLDTNINSAASNGGNPAGSTLYNSCLGTANWAVVIVYEDSSLPVKQLIVKDDIVRAWDYVYMHKGVWQRPQVKFTHSPMQAGAKFYVVAQTGNYAGISVNGAPTCGCGCGGTYYLKKTATAGSDKSSQYWSNTLVSPAAVANDPINKDKTNGPWTITQRTTFGSTVKRGNDWTLFQSGSKFTEFPNLYEGRNQAADTTPAVTAENSDDATNDKFGHPWNGRGTVKYHGWGNDLSAVEVAPDAANLITGSTETSFYFKGDQKDVFKPQERVTIRMLALEIPVDGGATTTTTGATTTTTTTSSTAGATTTTSSTAAPTTTTTTTKASTTTTTTAATTTTTTTGGACFKANNVAHVAGGRAYYSWGNTRALGSNQSMGLYNIYVTTKLRQTGPLNYVVDNTCP